MEQLEPEEIEERESSLLSKEFWSELKDKITENLQTLFSSPDPDIEQFEKNHESSLELSRLAGELYRSLIPRSMTSPDKTYEHVPSESIIDAKRKEVENLEENRFSSSIDEVAAAKEFIFPQEGRKFFHEKINIENGDSKLPKKEQYGRYVSKKETQEHAPLLIEETVTSDLYEDRNIAAATLLLKNHETGQILDLAALLPKGFVFCPAPLFQHKPVLDKNSDGSLFIKEVFVPVDLKTYRGTEKINEDDFAAIISHNRLIYGDLTEDGGILKLFHEISHAWQSVYYERGVAREKFDESHKKTLAFLFLLNRRKENLENKTIDENEYAFAFEYIAQKLAALDITIEPDRVFYDGGDMREGEIKITEESLEDSPITYRIKSPLLESLLSDYVKEERDAWAHALKVMRFLRDQGFDIEPTLNTLEDVETVINPCLESYQDSIDKMIKTSQSGVRFSK